MACVFLMVCCLGPVGCNTFGKKSQDKQDQPSASGGGASAQIGAPGYADRTQPATVSGVLAGRVLDSYDRNPPPAFIKVVQVGANGANAASAPAPVEVATDGQGFFAVRGLQPGQHYQLIARTRDGSPKLAGTVWATPPNPRILIYMSEDLYTQNTPPAPPPPQIPGQPSTQTPNNGAPVQNGAAPAESNRDPSKPSSSIPQQRAELGTPIKIEGDPSTPPPTSDVRLQDVVKGPGYANVPPVASIPPQPNQREGPPNPAGSLPALPTPVPSCVLNGKQLDNFALRDLSGQPWEYRTQHRGRLVLLDFWGSWCVPCRAAISHLRILQHNYGHYGLEVVGIAYENDAPFQEQVRKVQSVRDTWGINYQLLMGSSMLYCPVKTQFEVRSFPTLVLLDQNSRIIWRCDDGLTAEKLQDLELIVKQQLRLR
jgi:thiol-disulfide isomerase/thioredoxin